MPHSDADGMDQRRTRALSAGLANLREYISRENVGRIITDGRQFLAGRIADMRVRPQVVPPYHKPTTWRGRVAWLAFAPVLFVFCFIYGFFFSITAPHLIVQCSFPILLALLLSIWALPDERVAPTRLMHVLFAGFIAALCLWPSYLAVSLPGLPWFTPHRLFGMPLALVLLISLSISARFRSQLRAILAARPLVWKSLAAFTAMQFITLPLSDGISTSINKVIIQQVYWTTIFVMSAYLFCKKGLIPKYIGLICASVPVIFIYSYLEFQQQHLLWMAHVPKFLAVEDLEHILSPEFRFGTGVYRAKAIFSTALGLAQYVGVLSPFFIYYMHKGKTPMLKIAGAALLVMSYLAIEYSDSRLGLVGILWSFLLYIFVHVYMLWKKNPSNLFVSAVFYAYPAFFAVVMIASATVPGVADALWGGSATQGSNQARLAQIEMAIPQVMKNPIGYGAAQSGGAMGYGAGRFVTIDNYLINIVLDYGIVGLVSYLTLFISISVFGIRAAIAEGDQNPDHDMSYLIPLGVSISATLLIKLVFSQAENDPMLFMMSGMVLALLNRLDRSKAQKAEVVTLVQKPAPDPRYISAGRRASGGPRAIIRR